MVSTFKPGSTAFIIINPVAGFTEAKALKKTCETQFHAAGWHTRFYLTKADENLTRVVNTEIASGVDLVVVCGGDGTVAAVAAGLSRSRVPMGIIPTGTWNAIAHHLRLPASPQRAIDLMTGKHSLRRLDLMNVGKTVHAMNLGVGFSAKMVTNADRAEKRSLGNLAYIKHLLKELLGLEMHHFIIEADGIIYKGRASEIFVANYGIVGLRFLEDRLNIDPDDGKLDILIIKTRTLLDLPNLFWQIFFKHGNRTPKYQKISGRKKISISTFPAAQVQADGEDMGQTPVKVSVIPRAVQVICNPSRSERADLLSNKQ